MPRIVLSLADRFALTLGATVGDPLVVKRPDHLCQPRLVDKLKELRPRKKERDSAGAALLVHRLRQPANQEHGVVDQLGEA